jgi:hypothetical protein
MKGVVILAIVSVLLGCALGKPPLQEPRQYEQFCNDQKVAGTGIVDMSTSMIDKRIALEYFTDISGKGEIELDSERLLSEKASKITREVENGTKTMNLFENTKMTFSGSTPLVGSRYLHSKAFYGGIGSAIQESFSVNKLEQDQKTYFGSTTTASSAQLVGVETKGSFNGSWQTDAKWHKIFYKDIKSHQAFSGDFQIDRQVKFHEQAPYAPVVELTKTPTSAIAGLGDAVVYEYQVKNAGETMVSDLALVDEALGEIRLNKTVLEPGEETAGYGIHVINEEDLLQGPRNITATLYGKDNLGNKITETAQTTLTPMASYYPGATVTTGPGAFNGAGWVIYPDSFNLTGRTLTLYAMDVNMSQSRMPFPECPYLGWPAPLVSTLIQFGVTNSSSLSGLDPAFSAWQSLTLDPGYYMAKQAYRGGDNISSSEPLAWGTDYMGSNPSGGVHCTGIPEYDRFDLKLVLQDLGEGEGAGLLLSAYQRVHQSTEAEEPALEWRPLTPFQVPEDVMDKRELHPFVLVANTNTTAGGGAISWSMAVAAWGSP